MASFQTNIYNESLERVSYYMNWMLHESPSSVTPTSAKVAQWMDIIKSRPDADQFDSVLAECHAYITR
jgi:hypothetical protein